MFEGGIAPGKVQRIVLAARPLRGQRMTDSATGHAHEVTPVVDLVRAIGRRHIPGRFVKLHADHLEHELRHEAELVPTPGTALAVRRHRPEVGHDRPRVVVRQMLVGAERHGGNQQPTARGNPVPEGPQHFVVFPRPDAGIDVGGDVGDPERAHGVGVSIPAPEESVPSLGLGEDVAALPPGVAGAAGEHLVHQVAPAREAIRVRRDGLVTHRPGVAPVAPSHRERSQQPHASHVAPKH